MNLKTTAVNIIAIKAESNPIKKPYFCRDNIKIVIEPGPTRRGNANGTAPTSIPLATSNPFNRNSKESIKSKSPPAMLKCAKDIEKRLRSC